MKREDREPAPVELDFESVRGLLDHILIDLMLVDSLEKFLSQGVEYPFVDMRELKSGAAGSGLPESEVMLHNNGLVLLVDGILPAESKKHIRTREKCRVRKEQLASSRMFDDDFLTQFEVASTYAGRPGFEELLCRLTQVDYGLVVQQDSRSTRQVRYALTHFRVRIEGLVEDAVERMGHRFNYLKRHLYEEGEAKAEQLEAKFYERFGYHHTVGGRRTAAILAAQCLIRLAATDQPLDFSVYIGSAEARTLTRITSDKIYRYALIRLSKEEIDAIEERAPVRANHLIHLDTNQGGVGVLEVTYRCTPNSIPSKKHRGMENLGSLSFLKVEEQRLMPRRGTLDAEPVTVSVVYKAQE